MTMSRRLIAIVGPTGSGKSSLAVELAQRLGTEIISTDSRQFYRGMAIGTAQPTMQELAAVPHHFIADREPRQHINCGDYAVEATERLGELFTKHDTVVAVGGSGLYIDALCKGLDDMPSIDPVLRDELNNRLTVEGLASLTEQLRVLDAEYYEKVDLNNPQRVIRALEVCISSGTTYSSLRRRELPKRDFETIYIGTHIERAELYSRIDARVEAMIEQGLEAEARALYALRDMPALKTVGYKEMFDYFDGNTSLDRAIELIKQNSRRYAKRQMTWFLRGEAIKWLAPQDIDAAVNYILKNEESV